MKAPMSEQKGGGHDRRAVGRVDIQGQLPSQLELDLDTDVLQISVGGMMVEVPVPLAVGSKHQFSLSIDKHELDLLGVVRNCEPFPPGGQPETYRIGIEFCDLEEGQKASLADFVKKKLGN